MLVSAVSDAYVSRAGERRKEEEERNGRGVSETRVRRGWENRAPLSMWGSSVIWCVELYVCIFMMCGRVTDACAVCV